jgi:hypothetical protein
MDEFNDKEIISCMNFIVASETRCCASHCGVFAGSGFPILSSD